MNGHIGFSLYLSTPFEENVNIVKKFSNRGFTFVFTSLNISEENQNKEQIVSLLALCKTNQLYVIVDINEFSLKTFGVEGLKELGVGAIRIDDGISNEEIASLSRDFDIILNASTIDQETLENLISNQCINPKRLVACHNYYPKEYTGISLEKFKHQNLLCIRYGVKTIGFISGEVRRFPLYQGLSTVEEHRSRRPLISALECMVLGECDAVCIGDVDVNNATLIDFEHLSKGIIPLRSTVSKQYHEYIFENRKDASEYLIRAAFSRSQLKGLVHTGVCGLRDRGAVCVANEKYGRYQYELEIPLLNLPEDERQTIVGHVSQEDMDLLPFIQHPFKFRFI